MLLDERLSLTLDEIVHIRSVLTKAELESLPVEGRVKEDVEKRRVCFLCLKTRFGILGPWGQRCRLCKRTVCVKCYSKVSLQLLHTLIYIFDYYNTNIILFYSILAICSVQKLIESRHIFSIKHALFSIKSLFEVDHILTNILKHL